MNKTIVTIAFIFLLMPSCEEPWIIDCNQCSLEIPTKIFLDIDLHNVADYPVNIKITIYEGEIDDGIIMQQFTVDSNHFYQEAVLYKNYTVTAEYRINATTYICVDTACPSVKYDDSQCDSPCYVVYDNKIDLRLRYD